MLNSALPETATALIKLVGYPTTLAIVKRWGGRYMPVPAGSLAIGRAQYDALVEIAGEEGAKKIIAEYKSTAVYIPKCTQALYIETCRAIQEDYASGKSVNALAIKYNKSMRQISNDLAKCLPSPVAEDVAAERQFSLF